MWATRFFVSVVVAHKKSPPGEAGMKGLGSLQPTGIR
ncbi:hypothetical protein HAL1_06610 [Halomonas sp. HAL1]|nr:hypothetical protein HAL1_06610 [Halomonas sp. HAL1]